MTAAIVALAVALAAAVGGLIAFGMKALAAADRDTEDEASRRELVVRLEVATATTETEKRRADAEKERGDALDAALARAAARAVGPVDGSFVRLLQEVADAKARLAGRGNPALVRDAGTASAPSAPAGGDPADLLKPGQDA